MTTQALRLLSGRSFASAAATISRRPKRQAVGDFDRNCNSRTHRFLFRRCRTQYSWWSGDVQAASCESLHLQGPLGGCLPESPASGQACSGHKPAPCRFDLNTESESASGCHPRRQHRMPQTEWRQNGEAMRSSCSRAHTSASPNTGKLPW